MTDTTQFTIGAQAHCTDGSCGEVSRLVVDPVALAVTHLVVQPEHRPGLGRLVPLDLIESATEEVLLRCSTAEFDQLDLAEETEFAPESAGHADYSSAQVLSWPYYGLGGGIGMVGDIGPGPGLGGAVPPSVTYDKVPLGEVAVRRGQHVHATDGDIGRVEGLVIDPSDHHVTHVLLQEGHLWGRKEVAIPISAVTDVDDGIRLRITKQAVQDLPAVDVDHRQG